MLKNQQKDFNFKKYQKLSIEPSHANKINSLLSLDQIPVQGWRLSEVKNKVSLDFGLNPIKFLYFRIMKIAFVMILNLTQTTILKLVDLKQFQNRMTDINFKKTNGISLDRSTNIINQLREVSYLSQN